LPFFLAVFEVTLVWIRKVVLEIPLPILGSSRFSVGHRDRFEERRACGGW